METTSSSCNATSRDIAYSATDLNAGSDAETTTSDSTGSPKDFIVSDKLSSGSSIYEQASMGEGSSDDLGSMEASGYAPRGRQWRRTVPSRDMSVSRLRSHRPKVSLVRSLERIEDLLDLLYAVLEKLSQGAQSEGCTRERCCGVGSGSDSLDRAGEGTPRPRAVSSP